MNKERTAINLNSVVIFNGDVTDENLRIIPKDFRGDIVVNGNMSFKEDRYIPCNLWITGNVFCYCNRAIYVNGDCYIGGTIDSGNIKVDGDLYCKGYLNAHRIRIEGDLIVSDDKSFHKGDIISNDIMVAGDVFCEGDIRSKDIIVAGNLFCKGDIRSKDIIMLGDLEAKKCIYCHFIKEIGNLHCNDISSYGVQARGKIITKGINVHGYKIIAKGIKAMCIENYSELIIGC